MLKNKNSILTAWSNKKGYYTMYGKFLFNKSKSSVKAWLLQMTRRHLKMFHKDASNFEIIVVASMSMKGSFYDIGLKNGKDCYNFYKYEVFYIYPMYSKEKNLLIIGPLLSLLELNGCHLQFTMFVVFR